MNLTSRVKEGKIVPQKNKIKQFPAVLSGVLLTANLDLRAYIAIFLSSVSNIILPHFQSDILSKL